MAVLADRVRETSTTTGTGTLTLAGALPSYRSFNATFTNGALVYYVIQSATDYEIGVGTVGTGTLARTTVLRSSNAGALVSFAAGPKDVFCSYVADRAVTTVDAATLTNKTIDDYTNFIGANQLHIKVKATATLALGTVCKAVGWNAGENAVEVQAVSSSADIAIGVTDAVISIGDLGEIINTGYLEGIDTNAFAPGTILYPNTSGGFTATKPSSGTFQAVAYVLRQNVSNGTVFVEFTNPQAVEASTNTANTLVLRDGSGNFAAGTVTAALTGNASTATALQTARNINGVAFNGTADITVTAAAGTLSGATLASGVTASSLTSVGTLSTLQVSGNATFDTNTLFVDAVNNRVGVLTATPSHPFQLGSSTLIVDTSGNLGLGVVPSASFLSSIESEYGLLVGRASTNISQNAYYSTTGWRYIAATAASLFAQDDGVHQWLTAPSGTAGNAITFTQAMTLDASGALLVGTTTSIDSRFRVGGTHPATSTLQYGALIAPTFNTSATSAQLANYGQLTSAAGTYTTTDAATYWAAGPTLGAGHTVTNLYGFYYAGRATAGATNNYGLFVGNVSNGTSNFSIFTGTGKVRFGDVVIGANGTASAPAYSANADENTGLFFPAADVIGLSTGGTERVRIDSAGNLGLGVVPSAWTDANNRGFDIGVWASVAQVGGSTMVGLNTYATTSSGGWTYKNTAAAMLYRQATSGHLWFTAPSGTAGAAISFTQAMTLNASGSLGLGVTPSAWTVPTMEFPNQFALGTLGLSRNTYYDGVYKYITAAAASLYEPGLGFHEWYIAPSGTVGATISFTKAMTLDASGRLGIGTASPAAKLHINDGTGRNFIVTTDATQLGTAGIAIGGFNDTAGAYAPLSVLGSTIQFGTGLTERARIKSTGQLRFVPLAADPAGAETGDVYYNSSTNKLRVYNGAWVDLH